MLDLSYILDFAKPIHSTWRWRELRNKICRRPLYNCSSTYIFPPFKDAMADFSL